MHVIENGYKTIILRPLFRLSNSVQKEGNSSLVTLYCHLEEHGDGDIEAPRPAGGAQHYHQVEGFGSWRGG